MTERIFKFWILSFYLILSNHEGLAQDCGKAGTLIKRLNEEHLEPHKLDDTLSNRIFNEVFLQFDPAKIFFHQGDIASLERFRYSLDNEIVVGKCLFQVEFKKLLLRKIERTKKGIDSILAQGITFQNQQRWSLSSKQSLKFESNDKSLLGNILLDLKHDILGESFQRHRFKDTTRITLKILNDLLPTVTSDARQEFDEFLSSFAKEINQTELFESTYLKAIAKVYDPHSDYFTLTKKQQFEEDLSHERLSLGIDLDEDDFGHVQVTHIVPGGPAWKSGQVHKGDTPLQISWDNQAPVDLTNKDIDEIDNLFYEAKGKVAKLTVRKPSGEKIVVELEKAKIENTENSILGFVLKGKHKIGYIHLPGFFSDEAANSVNGCANEVAKEILKLNKQKIEGLIFDLRDNGGGSLQEAVDLAGIFVDGGPMTIIEEKGQMPVSVKDMNRGMAFTGPMVVLVNGHSASASELVAAALQDYNRAVIVGSQTFGKATGQVVLPLVNNSQTDFFKVTTNRLYRLTQKSLQQAGVMPDILLPEIGAPLQSTERSYRYSLTNKPISKKIYYNVHPLFYFETWVTQSQARLESNPNFKSINMVNQMLMGFVPLQAEEFIRYSNTIDEKLKHATKSNQPLPYTVSTSESFEDVLDAYRKPSENHVKDISSNPYIQEAFHIICDIIKSKK